MMDKTNSLNEDKLHKLLFLKKNLLILKEIKKELIKHHAQPKRRLSLTDHQSALSINQSENLPSTLTSKKKLNEEMKMTMRVMRTILTKF